VKATDMKDPHIGLDHCRAEFVRWKRSHEAPRARHNSTRAATPHGTGVEKDRSQSFQSAMLLCRKKSGTPQSERLVHDPEKWKPVFGKDHAPTQNLDLDPIRFDRIKV
jgi:hypothetical protein